LHPLTEYTYNTKALVLSMAESDQGLLLFQSSYRFSHPEMPPAPVSQKHYEITKGTPK